MFPPVSRGPRPQCEDIAATVAALVPHPSVSVSELVKARLPTVISEHEAAKIPPKNHLVNLVISGTLSDVLEGPIVHRTWLTKLQDEHNKAQKAGCIITSIQHPTQADLTLPLWALPVWDSMAVPSQDRMLWVKATKWLKPSNHRREDHVRTDLANRPTEPMLVSL